MPEHVKRIVKPIHPKNTDEWPNIEDDFAFESDEESNDDDPRWVHQSEAVALFLEDKDKQKTEAPMPAGRQGILCMATGTGKTRTALKIVKSLFETGEIEKVIITTHKVDLLHQWARELKDQSRGLLNHIETEYRHYDGDKQGGNFIFGTGKRCLLIGRKGFQEILGKFSSTPAHFSKTLLIVDECHNYRGEGGREKLSGLYENIPFRLGLSATPENEYNDEATKYLYDELGPIFYNFDLLNAIENGILCPFEYHGHSYTPTAKEISDIGEIKKNSKVQKRNIPLKQ